MIVRSGAARSTVAAVASSLLLLSCTHQASESPEETGAHPLDVSVEAFVEAWNDRDYQTMDSFFTGETRMGAHGLEAQVKNVLSHGGIEDFEATLDGSAGKALDESDDSASAAYSVEFTSLAVAKPVELDGEMEWILDPVEDEWELEWRPALMFPAHPKAAALEIETKWLERGAILDRDGRKLAVGAVTERRYPWGSVAGSVIGHIGAADKAQAKALDLVPGDLIGGSGLEEGLQEVLAGRPGTTLQVVSKKGKVLEKLGSRKGKPGKNVKTTLDIEIQRASENAYGATTGGAVVMDPKTGDLLAIVSSSPFNPNSYIGVNVSPFNRALEGRYPPGSSMKVVTAAAALDTGTVTPDTQLSGPSEYQGVRNFESGEFGTLSFASAVQFSVNTAFAQVALDLGTEKLIRYAELFGFNRVPEMPLAAAEPSFPDPVGAGDLMWASIGQAQVLATPLQMATVAATIANGGKRMEPRITNLEAPVGERVVTKKTASTMTELMINVVVGGTGQGARLSGIDVAGKTGTAEVDVDGERKNHAWFICFAPADEPSVAVAVVSEYGGVGGEVAAPLARQILSNTMLIIQSDEFRAGNG
jgi:cell division protein FtsI/penicillin-binding protein 2